MSGVLPLVRLLHAAKRLRLRSLDALVNLARLQVTSLPRAMSERFVANLSILLYMREIHFMEKFLTLAVQLLVNESSYDTFKPDGAS